MKLTIVQDMPGDPEMRFLVMTALHLSDKPWQVRKALSMAQGCGSFSLGAKLRCRDPFPMKE